MDTYGNITKQTFYNTASTIVLNTEYSAAYGYSFPTKQSIQKTDLDGVATTVNIQQSYELSTGRILSYTDGKGNQNQYQYDALGRIIVVTNSR